jgi:polysaccharide chain length determinant protein (PEP-CTERM system associated)
MSGLAVQPNVDQQVMMLSRTLISRPNVEKLVRMADLDLNVKSKTAQDALIDSVMARLVIKSGGRDNLYTLTYKDGNPDRARRVVQSLATIFIDSGLNKQKDSSSAKTFIEEQIVSYEKKLAEAEARLKDFKLRNIDLQLSEGKGLTDRVYDINAELSRARQELREAENSRDALRRQIAGEEPVLLFDSPSMVSDTVPELDGRIEAQKRSLDALLQRYTEQHPDVIGARRLIRDLEEQKRQELALRKKVTSDKSTKPVNTNPVYQQMKIALGEAEARVASLRARVAGYQAQYGQVVGAIRTKPQLEAELAQLNRDYEIHRKNYAALVERRESASLSGELEQTGSVATFRLIDPPRATSRPVAPNRQLLLSMALLVALGSGVAIAFVASQLRPVFFDARSLREVTGIPILGSVSLIKNELMQRKEKTDMRRFLGAFGGLIGVYVAGIVALSFLSGRVA